MRTYKTEGIVIKRVNIGEADRIITVLTKYHGKVRLMAKGVRRITSRRAPNLELFNYAQFVVREGKGIDTISDAQSITSFQNLKAQFSLVSTAYMIAEILERLLPEKQEQYLIFVKTVDTLFSIDQNAFNVGLSENILFEYKLFLLDHLGFLHQDQIPTQFAVDHFIEQTIERKLKSRTLFC